MNRLWTVLRGIVSGALAGVPLAYIYGLIGFALGWYGPGVIWFGAAQTIAFGAVSGVLLGGTLGTMQHRTRKRAAYVGLGMTAVFYAMAMSLVISGATGPRNWAKEAIINLGPVLLFVPLALLTHRLLEWWLRTEPIEAPEPAATTYRSLGSEPRRYRL